MATTERLAEIETQLRTLDVIPACKFLEPIVREFEGNDDAMEQLRALIVRIVEKDGSIAPP